MPFGWWENPENMARQRKFEDKKDPDKCRASKAYSFPIRAKAAGEVGATSTIWDIKDDESLVLVEWADGAITAYIESDKE